MPHLLKNLQIFSVDSVDRGAGEAVKVLLMKRNNQENEMQTYVIAKAMAMPERELIAFVKTDAISKQELGVLIDDMAQAKHRDGESRQQAYARFVTQNPIVQDLFKIHQAAPGPDH
jgi:formate-dependent phosphoribosylglycinamide formyltransferase (GAR transformylase)